MEQRGDARVARDGSRHTQKRFIPREGIEADGLRQIDEHADRANRTTMTPSRHVVTCRRAGTSAQASLRAPPPGSVNSFVL